MIMKRLAAGFATLVLVASTAWAQQGEVYGVILFNKDLMIPMRDGVRLAADVYRPAVDGVPLSTRLPILLQQTPYNKEGSRLVDTAKYFASRGYVVVLEDDRGTYKSEGVLTKYIGSARTLGTLSISGSASLNRGG